MHRRAVVRGGVVVVPPFRTGDNLNATKKIAKVLAFPVMQSREYAPVALAA